jgi:hypothetical protein
VPHAGWYNDETDPTLARWFDGVAWTEHAVVKADWEAIGQPPPPPVELAAGGASPRSGRIRMAVGSAAVAVVLVVAGVALAQDGDDPPAEDRPTAQDRDVADRFGDDVDELDSLGDTVGDVPTDASASDDDGGGGSSSASGSTKTSTSSKKTTQDGTVTRTERRSESHVIPGTSEAVGSGDQSDVGNDTNKNIDIDYEQVDPSTTTTASPPPSTEDTTAPPPSVPADGETDTGP